MPTIVFALQHRLLDDLDGGASVSAGCVCLQFRVAVDLGLVACRRPLRVPAGGRRPGDNSIKNFYRRIIGGPRWAVPVRYAPRARTTRQRPHLALGVSPEWPPASAHQNVAAAMRGGTTPPCFVFS